MASPQDYLQKLKKGVHNIPENAFTDALNGEEGGWTLEKLIGHGTYSRVYLAVNTTTKEFVALKIVPFVLLDYSFHYTIVRELCNPMYLPHDDNLIQALRIGFVKTTGENSILDQKFFECGHAIVIEFPLFNGDITRRRFKSKHFKSIVYQMLRSVAILESHNLLHGDIKSTNFMYRRQRQNKKVIVALGDFGLSQSNITTRNRQEPGNGVYATLFRPPEVHRNKEYTTKADVWALGCAIFQLHQLVVKSKKEYLFPVLSDEGLSKMHSSFQEFDPKSFDKGSFEGEEFVDLLRKMLVKDPEKRSSASELLNHPYFSSLSDSDKQPLPPVQGAQGPYNFVPTKGEYKGAPPLSRKIVKTCMRLGLGTQTRLSALMLMCRLTNSTFERKDEFEKAYPMMACGAIYLSACLYEPASVPFNRLVEKINVGVTSCEAMNASLQIFRDYFLEVGAASLYDFYQKGIYIGLDEMENFCQKKLWKLFASSPSPSQVEEYLRETKLIDDDTSSDDD